MAFRHQESKDVKLTCEGDFSRPLEISLVADEYDGHHLGLPRPLQFEPHLVGFLEAAAVGDGVDQQVGVAAR